MATASPRPQYRNDATSWSRHSEPMQWGSRVEPQHQVPAHKPNWQLSITNSNQPDDKNVNNETDRLTWNDRDVFSGGGGACDEAGAGHAGITGSTRRRSHKKRTMWWFNKEHRMNCKYFDRWQISMARKRDLTASSLCFWFQIFFLSVSVFCS